MREEEVRTHVMLPRAAVEDIDRLVGHRRRSQFVAEAVKEKLRREKLLAALDATAGILEDVDIPHWETPERTSAWVRGLRQEDDETTERSLHRWKAE